MYKIKITVCDLRAGDKPYQLKSGGYVFYIEIPPLCNTKKKREEWTEKKFIAVCNGPLKYYVDWHQKWGRANYPQYKIIQTTTTICRLNDRCFFPTPSN